MQLEYEEENFQILGFLFKVIVFEISNFTFNLQDVRGNGSPFGWYTKLLCIGSADSIIFYERE